MVIEVVAWERLEKDLNEDKQGVAHFKILFRAIGFGQWISSSIAFGWLQTVVDYLIIGIGHLLIT